MACIYHNTIELCLNLFMIWFFTGEAKIRMRFVSSKNGTPDERQLAFIKPSISKSQPYKSGKIGNINK